MWRRCTWKPRHPLPLHLLPSNERRNMDADVVCDRSIAMIHFSAVDYGIVVDYGDAVVADVDVDSKR